MSEKHPIMNFIQTHGGLDVCSLDDLRNCQEKLMHEHALDWPSVEQRAARAEALAIINGELLRRHLIVVQGDG